MSEVFNNIYKNAPPDDPLVLVAQAEKDAPKAIAVTEEDEQTDESRVSSFPTEPQPLVRPPEPERRSVGGFFRRLFGR